MEDMDIKQIISLLIKHIWKIIIATIICGILGYVISTYFIVEKFESSSLMYISSNKNAAAGEDLTYNEYNLNIKLVNSYSALCKTDRILNKVLDETGLDISLGSISYMISVNSVNNTEIIEIVVKNENPETATIIANAVAVVFTREIPNIIKMDNVQIIDYATVPISPVSPNVMMNTLIAMLVGLFLSVLIIFLVEFLDVSIKERTQLEELLDAPVFGIIPKADVPKKNNKLKNGLISSPALKEAFVRLASNIGFLNITPKSVAIVLTSALMTEGKSTVVSNLGIALARNNKKVLIIDADMRRPFIHKLFMISNRSGLSSALSSDAPWKQFVLTTQFDNLDVITAGIQPPNPMMLLSATKMKKILFEAKEIYDYVLIDTPPVLVVSDILGLCSDVDHILLVVRYKQVTMPDIHRVKEDFAQINAPLSGSILNNYEPKSGKNRYGYGYGYYDNRENEDTNRKKDVDIAKAPSNKRRNKSSYSEK
jgi:polysaccharide biosynthesis transport protein